MRSQLSLVSAVHSVSFDALEQRRLYSVSAHLSNGNLIVEGDDKANTIVIEHTGAWTLVNGQPFLDIAISKGVSVFPSLTPKNSSAVDSVQIRSSAKPITINAGKKSPLFDAKLNVTIGENGKTAGVTKEVLVHPNGQTRLIVDNNAATASANASLDYVPMTKLSTLVGVTPAPVRFDGTAMSAIDVRLGQGNDLIVVRGTAPLVSDAYQPAQLTIDGGRGANAINILNADGFTDLRINNTRGGYDGIFLGGEHLVKVHAPISVSNTSGLSSITLDDKSDTASGQKFTLTTGNVVFQSGGYKTFNLTFNPSQIDGLKIIGGDAAVEFSVYDTLHASSPTRTGLTTIWGGSKPSQAYLKGTTGPVEWHALSGSNGIYLGDENHSTAGLKGDINLKDYYYNDSLQVDNTAAKTAQFVTIKSRESDAYNVMTGASPATIRYGGSTNVSLWTGLGNDVVRITGDSRFATTQVHTGAGNDVIELGNDARRLDDFHGANVVLDGGTGHDNLYVIDTAAQKPAIYLNGVGYFQRIGTTAIWYSNFEGVTVLK